MYLGTISNLLGFITLILYSLTLLPTLVRLLFSSLSRTKWNLFLTKYRRSVGVITFVFALFHGISVGIERNLDFTLPSTWVTYFQGITMMIIMILLAITSNDFSLRNLKRNWKRLHTLTYIILIILPWHVIDKMSHGWSVFTPIALLLIFILISLEVFRFVRRK